MTHLTTPASQYWLVDLTKGPPESPFKIIAFLAVIENFKMFKLRNTILFHLLDKNHGLD
jgi:hypothetical protein